MLRLIVLISLTVGAYGPSARSGPRDEASLSGRRPASILRLVEGSHALLVEKATQSLILYRGDDNGDPELVRVLQTNTGERDGDKRREGDLRTPEGIYFFTGVIDGSKLPPEYGVRAFVTDFPNPFDRLAGKSGSNIWLHATDNPRRVLDGYNTRGCVVVTNDDLNGLTPLIRPGRTQDATPMVVEDRLVLLEPARARRERAEIEQLVAAWESAWESMEIERYMDFYSRDFRGMGRDYDSWKAYKGRLTRQYSYIRVELSDLHLFRHDGELVAAFDQYYESNRFSSHAAKRLYFRLESGGWKIVRETSQPLPR